MKANEAITLDACLLALLHYDDSVPTELHEQIQTAKAQIANGQPEAINHLKKIIEKNDQLKALYANARRYLVVQNQPQERAKSAATTFSPLPSAPSVAGFSLADVATAILSSPNANYRANAQHVLNKSTFQKQLAQAPEELRSSVKALTKAANRLHPTKVAMMRKIDDNFFTVDDIAYSLEIPLDGAQRYAKSLWNEGYIRPISSNLLKQWWWSLKGAPQLTQVPDSDSPLTLTNKGYFYLHPGTLGRALSKEQRFV